MKRGKNIPYWLKGLLLSILGLTVIIIIAALSIFFKLLPKIGFFIILLLLGIASFIGVATGELINFILPINIKLIEGGGTPTLTAQLLALVVYVFLGAFIGWIYGRCKYN